MTRLRLALLAGALLAPALLGAQEPSLPFHIARYQIEAELIPPVHQLKARARLTLVAAEPLVELTLHLNKNLKIERILDAAGNKLSFEQLPQVDNFTLALADSLSPGQTLDLTVEFDGVLDPALKPEHGPLLAAIAPGHSYLLRESRWFPQSANVWARFAMTLEVTVPDGTTVLSSGVAQGPAPAQGSRARFTFRTDDAALAGTVVAGEFERIEAAEAPITFYLRTAPGGYASSNSERIADILAFYSEKFSPLADPALALVEVPDLDLESYAAPGLLLLPTRQWSATMDYRVLARGLARQWWAVHVSPRRASDAWLAEGLARYSEALYVEHTAGLEAFQQVRHDMTIGALVDETAAPIANAHRIPPFSPQFNSIVRDKGAMVFHMLRHVIGEEAFGRLLSAYAERFAGRGVTLEEFERLAEEISGEPLDYFFGEWLRSTGVPQFAIEYIVYRTREGFRVTGAIEHELEIFRMPVPVHIETEGPPVMESVSVAGVSSEFNIETFGRPLRVEIDPEFEVLKYTPDLRLQVAIARGESLFEQGKLFEATREYQHALEVKRDSSLAHYRMGEAFFEQRNYQAAANAFREATAGDKLPPWTVVWSHIFLGKVFDLTGQRERAINEYRRALDANIDAQGAREEAQRYLREPYRRESRTIQRIERR